MIYWLKENWPYAAFILAAWSAVGLFASILMNIDSPSGCIYKSYGAFLNPGYIIGCEIYRKRFCYKGIDRALFGPPPVYHLGADDDCR